MIRIFQTESTPPANASNKYLFILNFSYSLTIYIQNLIVECSRHSFLVAIAFSTDRTKKGIKKVGDRERQRKGRYFTNLSCVHKLYTIYIKHILVHQKHLKTLQKNVLQFNPFTANSKIFHSENMYENCRLICATSLYRQINKILASRARRFKFPWQ